MSKYNREQTRAHSSNLRKIGGTATGANTIFHSSNLTNGKCSSNALRQRANTIISLVKFDERKRHFGCTATASKHDNFGMQICIPEKCRSEALRQRANTLSRSANLPSGKRHFGGATGPNMIISLVRFDERKNAENRRHYFLKK